jgi:glucokinase
MEFNITENLENFKKEYYSSYILGADIGGTNTRIAVAGIQNNKVILIFTINVKSNKLDAIPSVISEVLNYSKTKFDIEITHGCIGAAGVVSKDKKYAELTNTKIVIDTSDIIEKTSLKSIFIINDFEAVGYGINLLNLENNNDVFILRNNHQTNNQTKVAIGAGTGLGKSILVYDKKTNFYYPIPCEGGHCDFTAYNDLEMELLEYAKKMREEKYPVIYEDFLSGRGVTCIYNFIRTKNIFPETEYTSEIDDSNDKTPLISKYRSIDDTCKEVFRIFTKFYGRCAKNFVLDCLATGGLFIAGGMALKNKEIFKTDEFFKEFENVYQYNNIMKSIPIYVVTNEDIGLLGACFAAAYENLGVLNCHE